MSRTELAGQLDLLARLLLARHRLLPTTDAPLEVDVAVTLRPRHPIRLRVRPREVHHG